ncbi:MAG: transposase [Planctomycetaceae bacterium]|nr:transposase [Planctomycetaceae bacterium]
MNRPICNRYWLLTWTMYGNRLAGDARGFVSNVREGTGPEVRHNIPGTPFDSGIPELEQHIRERMKGPPVRIGGDHATALLAQFEETAGIRNWSLMAVSIMAQHVHIVVGVPGDPDPERLLNDFKRYGTQRLNRSWSTPASGRWWTRNGSKRKLKDDDAVLVGVKYTIDQEYPLLVWTNSIPELDLPGGRIL